MLELTLEISLAGVLGVERLVLDITSAVVEKKFEERLDLLFSVTRVVGNGVILFYC